MQQLELSGSVLKAAWTHLGPVWTPPVAEDPVVAETPLSGGKKGAA